MTYCYTDANGEVHYRTINVPVSLRKVAGDNMRTRKLSGPRVELLGNTSFGKIVRPEFGGASIAAGTLKPLTRFDS